MEGVVVKHLFVALVAALAVFTVVGCSAPKATKAENASSSGVLDIAPTPPTMSAVTQTPVAPQPVTIEPAPASYTTTPSSATNSTAANIGQYKIKKGDTLYGIARTTYGDGKQWQKIASANPGLSPTSLKVGQTITIP
jgi:5'-nucleotidase/UDP-sugar diphosphatase